MTGARLLSRPSPTGMPARSRLKRETDDLHRAVEASFEAADWFATPERYRDYLLRWSALLAAFAQSLDGFTDRIGPAIDDRARLLAEDLADLGARPPAGTPDLLPRAADLAEAFGCAYVLEGSALGGRILAKRVADSLGAAAPVRFLGGGRTDDAQRPVGPVWLEFLARLEGALPTAAEVDRAVAAARRTFIAVGRMLEADASALSR